MATDSSGRTIEVALLHESPEGEAILAHAAETLAQFGVGHTTLKVLRVGLRSHLPPYEGVGVRVFIVANTDAVSLAGAVEKVVGCPVLAVPVAGPLAALDALQASMSAGVGTLAVGKAGAINAALLAVAILANGRADLAEKMRAFRAEQTAKVLGDVLE